MASHDSAIKAHRQNLVKREANRQYRTRLRGALRAIRAAIDAGDPAKVKDALRDTISLVDKMAGKKVIHRNAAARYKSRLAKRVSKRTSASAWGAGLVGPAPQLHHQPLQQDSRIPGGTLQIEIRPEQRIDRGGNAPRIGHAVAHEPGELPQNLIWHTAGIQRQPELS